jgi:type IV secretion system protein TrbG
VTSYGFTQNPEVLKAFENYQNGNDDYVVHAPGFVTYPYDPYARPIVECAPLRVCTIQLEKGEQINHVSIGDSTRWMVSNFLTGPNDKDGSQAITVKPAVTTDGISTDLVISTDRRIYNIGLVSSTKSTTNMINFYYPQETVEAMNLAAAERMLEAKKNQKILGNSAGIKGTVVNVKDINTDYTMSGDDPAWKPEQIFDDGQKTFIKMPPIADRMKLPVVWVLTPNGDKEPLNARYNHPYFILDGLYQNIYLISGESKKKLEVTITNNNITAK